jgi:aminoacrylate peracid reductase
MTRKTIQPASFPKPLAKYSAGVLSDKTLYVSGMLAMDAKGNVIGVDDIEAQTRHVLESIKTVVTEAGGTMSDVVHNAIFLKSFADYQGMNKVYGEYFQESPPARYCIGAALYKSECLIEISTVAVLA